MKRSWWERHWITPLCLAPFVSMFLLHRWLSLPEEILARTRPGEESALLYNCTMVLAFYGGICAYVVHAAAMLQHDAPWRGLIYLGVKLLALIYAWGWFIS